MRRAAAIGLSLLLHGAALLWLVAPASRQTRVIEAMPIALHWAEETHTGHEAEARAMDVSAWQAGDSAAAEAAAALPLPAEDPASRAEAAEAAAAFSAAAAALAASPADATPAPPDAPPSPPSESPAGPAEQPALAAGPEAPPRADATAALPLSSAEAPPNRPSAEQAAAEAAAAPALPLPPPPAPPPAELPRRLAAGLAALPPVLGGGGVMSGPSRGPIVRDPGCGGAFAYPEAARRSGAQGSVLMRLTVGPDGTVLAVQVVESAGHPALDRAARDGALRCRFEPALEGGRPVVAIAPWRVTFRLDR
jgi:protein TonB